MKRDPHIGAKKIPIEMTKTIIMKIAFSAPGKLIAAIGVLNIRIVMQPMPWMNRSASESVMKMVLSATYSRVPRQNVQSRARVKPRIMSFRLPQRALNLLRKKPRKTLGRAKIEKNKPA